MSYRVDITASARRERRRLDETNRQRIDAVLRRLTYCTRPTGARKLAGSQHDWRIRVGDYRILDEIDETQRVITIWRIDRRREAYR